MILDASQHNIERAAVCLRDGGVVAMPTETVYGLAADATNDLAVAKIFAAKGRPQFNPLITHYADARDMQDDVVFDTPAQLLASLFWPGPLTLVLPRRDGARLSLLTAAGLPTQAVRIPAHPVARALIRAAGTPLAAPSANRSGTLSPTTPAHVHQGLGDAVDYILAGGRAAVGLESTVVDLTGDTPVLLRHGAITLEELQMHVPDIVVETTPAGDRPKSPGQILKHYAPRASLRLRAVDVAADESLLAFGSLRFMGVRGGGAVTDLPAGKCLNLSEKGDLTEAAANLFAMLHQLDMAGAEKIAVMDIPKTGLGAAINDRLSRAAAAQQAG